MQLIQDWVERGTAPERVVVTKKQQGEVVLSRPVFPYPARTVYDGVGDPSVESSFLKDQ
jgi:feruloyl esterase